VQMLWTVLVFCGRQGKTGPQDKVLTLRKRPGYPRRSVQIQGENGFQKQMRPGPATRAASFVDLRSLPFRHLGQRNDGTGSAALARAPHLPLRQTAIQNRRSLTPAGASSPTPAQRAGGEEAAMPGQPVRTHARSVSPGNSPSRITGLPLASPQSSFGEPHEVQRFR
jgi:hypothetical protein